MQANQEKATTGTNRKLLASTLGSEEYGIHIQGAGGPRLRCRAKIDNAPEFIKGVINLRCIIVPIVDMRIKFKLGKISYDKTTVVLNVINRKVGMAVDGVSDVTALQAEQIKPAPDSGPARAPAICKGPGSVDKRMIILVDMGN